MFSSCGKQRGGMISCHCHLLPSPPLPLGYYTSDQSSLAAAGRREEGQAAERESGDHSAKYNADGRTREENVQNGQLQS